MLKKIVPAFIFTLLLASCSSIKPITFENSRTQASVTNDGTKKEPKFLDISAADESKESSSTIKEERLSRPVPAKSIETSTNTSESDKAAASLQLKYSQLLNTDPSQIQDLSLYQTIDDWYGTHYRLGGTSKQGIDCSAFVQTIFASVFGITLPRMAKDQYKMSRRISRTRLQEGDLLFFNTRGGVSHVGIYLQNNKFVHASVSGVMISDMFETYYVRHFVAAGRVAGLNSSASLNP